MFYLCGYCANHLHHKKWEDSQQRGTAPLHLQEPCLKTREVCRCGRKQGTDTRPLSSAARKKGDFASLLFCSPLSLVLFPLVLVGCKIKHFGLAGIKMVFLFFWFFKCKKEYLNISGFHLTGKNKWSSEEWKVKNEQLQHLSINPTAHMPSTPELCCRIILWPVVATSSHSSSLFPSPWKRASFASISQHPSFSLTVLVLHSPFAALLLSDLFLPRNVCCCIPLQVSSGSKMGDID